MRVAWVMAAVALGCGMAGSARAQETGCVGVAIKDVPAQVQDGWSLTKGEKFTDLNLQSVTPEGDAETYGEEGGYNYPAGDIQLLNCHLKRSPNESSPGFTYSLALDNTPQNASTILETSIDGILINAGMDNADAGSGAYAYVHAPTTACGQAVKAILAGHTELVNVVVDGGVCQLPTPASK